MVGNFSMHKNVFLILAHSHLAKNFGLVAPVWAVGDLIAELRFLDTHGRGGALEGGRGAGGNCYHSWKQREGTVDEKE